MWNGQYPLMTLEEVIELVQTMNRDYPIEGRSSPTGLYIEPKFYHFYQSNVTHKKDAV